MRTLDDSVDSPGALELFSVYGPCVGSGGGSPGPTPGGPMVPAPGAGGNLELPGPSDGLNGCSTRETGRIICRKCP